MIWRSILNLFLVPLLVTTLAACSEPNVDPVKTAQRYEGKIVMQPPANRGKEDGWYLVQGGKRKWIINAEWLARNNLDPKNNVRISSAEFNAIPEDPMPLR